MILRTLGSLLVLVTGCRAHADRAVAPEDSAPTTTAAEATPEATPAPTTVEPAPTAPAEPPAPAPVEPAPIADPPAPAPAPGPAPLVEGANVTVESIEADGLVLAELACAVEGGMPILGTLAIAASLAKQKKAMDRCAPKGQAFVVTWTSAGGKVVKKPVVRGGTNAQNSCIALAFTRTSAPIDGTCGTVVLAGDATHAATTVEAVRATE